MFDKLKFDNEMIEFLYKNSISRISVVLLHGDSNILEDIGNYIRRDKNQIDTLTYLPKGKYINDDIMFSVDKSRVKIKIGRFIKKFIKESTFKDLNISDKDIENFVNLFKSYFNSNTDELIVVSGEEIKKWYLQDNYSTILGSQSGSLWKSCMRQSERNIFMNLYVNNSDKVKMLIFLNKDGKLRSRALIWEDVTDTDGNKYKVMDRIYSLYDHDIFIFKKWAIENGYITKWEQNAKSESAFDVDGKLSILNLSVKLENYRQDYYPYLDTFKYFDIYSGIFSNSESNKHQYKLVQSNGMKSRPEPETEPEFYEDDYIDFEL